VGCQPERDKKATKYLTKAFNSDGGQRKITESSVFAQINQTCLHLLLEALKTL
jgi:hypothetical protein